MRNLLFIVLFSISYSLLFSQRSYYKSYSTAEGLAQSQVTSICQDSIGYLWIGTLGGISKYNGATFQNYSSDNGLLNNRVYVLRWIDNKLYVGHQGGISIIHNDKIEQISLDKDLYMLNITDIVSFKGQLIIATNGEGLYRLKDNKLVPFQLLEHDNLYVRDLLIWKNDLIIATRGGVLKTNDLKKCQLLIEENEVSISSLAIWKDQLLISTFYNGIQFYDPIKKRITKTKFENSGFLFNNVYVDSKNNIWISTSNGLIKYNEREYALYESSNGLPFNVISTTFEDQDNTIWIGTQGKGLVKSSQLNILYYDKLFGLPSDLILSGFQDKEGNYFFGTMDKGVIKTRDFINYTTIETDPTVWCAINDVNGFNWFGTKYGLYSLDANGKTKRFIYEDGVPGFKITTFHKINSQSMYVGGSHGIVLYKEGKFTPIATNGNTIGTIRNIIVHNNNLIVGSDMGLYRLNRLKKRFDLVGQLNRTVFSLIKTDNQRLFIGTEDGLYELKDETKIERVRYSSDVASNYINFLNIYNDELLIGTNNGLYIINIEKPDKNIKRIGTPDGLIDAETNINSSFIDKDGILWFGTASALIKLDLKKMDGRLEKVKLKFDHVLLNFEKFNYQEYGANFIDNVPQYMSFPYNKKNLQFNFDGVSINNNENIFFQYKLEGQSEVWMPSTKTPYIILSGLPAGNYTLHARILLEDETAVDQLQIHFTINEAFYKTWWFISLIILTFSILIFYGFRLRIRREQIKNELEKTEFKARLITLEQQSLNASMNRHFIFNSLNSIQYFINISDKISANKYLTSFAKLIRKNLDSSNEENGLVTLAEELDRIKLYLSLESMRFKGKFNYDIETNNVDLESYFIPAMMIQPFVENSIIHGVLPQAIEKLGQITISIEEIEGYLSIIISDNGIGIEKSISQKHEQYGDHKSQGMEITIKRIDLIEKISGKEMHIDGPKQFYNSNGEIAGTMVEIKIVLNSLEY